MAMGLKESKKFAIGSIHENGGGKFEILERWFDEDTDTIMLKYRYEDGKIETNKEVNVNASEWKWRKVRGLAGKTESPHEGETVEVTNMEEYFEGLYVRLEKLITENRSGVNHLDEMIVEHHKLNMEMMALLQVQQKQIEVLVNDRELINKLLEKI